MAKHIKPTPKVDWANSRRSLVVKVMVSFSESFLPMIEVGVEHGQVKVLHPGNEFSA